MAAAFACPRCGARFPLTAERIARKVRCGRCGHGFVVVPSEPRPPAPNVSAALEHAWRIAGNLSAIDREAQRVCDIPAATRSSALAQLALAVEGVAATLLDTYAGRPWSYKVKENAARAAQDAQTASSGSSSGPSAKSASPKAPTEPEDSFPASELELLQVWRQINEQLVRAERILATVRDGATARAAVPLVREIDNELLRLWSTERTLGLNHRGKTDTKTRDELSRQKLALVHRLSDQKRLLDGSDAKSLSQNRVCRTFPRAFGAVSPLLPTGSAIDFPRFASFSQEPSATGATAVKTRRRWLRAK